MPHINIKCPEVLTDSISISNAVLLRVNGSWKGHLSQPWNNSHLSVHLKNSHTLKRGEFLGKVLEMCQESNPSYPSSTIRNLLLRVLQLLLLPQHHQSRQELQAT